MAVAAIPDNESDRLKVLRDLEILDTPPEAEFEAIVRAASSACATPISLFSLIDAERQWFKANHGLPGVVETSRDIAFCSHAILGNELFEVPNATKGPRFIDNPLVTGEPKIRFYAGMPLRLSDGNCVGTLCVIDRRPRKLSAGQRETLDHLAHATVARLEAHRAIHLIKKRTFEQQLQLRSLYELTPAMLLSVDLQGRFLTVSDRWVEKMGYTRSEALGTSSLNIFTPTSLKRIQPIIQAAFAANKPCDNLECQMVTKRGEILDMLLSITLEYDSNDNPLRYVAVVEDITLKRRTENALHIASERARLATDSGQIGIWDWDIVNDILIWDDWMWRIYGQQPNHEIGTYAQWQSCVHPDDLHGAEKALSDALSSKHPFDTEFRIIWPDSSIHYLRGTANVTRDAEGNAIRMIGANWDITRLRNLATELAQQHELLRVTLKSIGEAVITTDAKGRVQWLNPIAEELTGWTCADAEGKLLTQVFNVVNEETRNPVENPCAICIAQGKVVGLANHTILISRNGEECGIEDSAAPICSEDGDILGVVLVFRDVTEQRRLSGEMTYRATHDSLTGLISRGEFELRLSNVLRKAHEEHSEHVLLFIDLDQFKLVNDTCGHSAGDYLLELVAKQFATVVRAHDTLARLGGDEFAIILEHCSADQAERLAEKICEHMEAFRFSHEGQQFRIGASIGLVPINHHCVTAVAILRAADSACYAAKESGRNCVHRWHDSDQELGRRGEMQWTTRIEQALLEDRFDLYAQQIDALHKNGTLHKNGASKGNGASHKNTGLHAEILLRMRDENNALIAPGRFLQAAARFHLISDIDRWVIDHIIALLADLPSLSDVDLLSINLSDQSIGDRAFHRWVVDRLTATALPIRSKLCFEITETYAVANPVDTALFIEEVRALGVRIALDDFGGGSASFAYLKNMIVDFLKIDGQFIRDLTSDPLDEIAVRGFAEVAKLIEVQTIAEYVEEPVVLKQLRDMGIDFAQGFLIHTPEALGPLLAQAGR